MRSSVVVIRASVIDFGLSCCAELGNVGFLQSEIVELKRRPSGGNSAGRGIVRLERNQVNPAWPLWCYRLAGEVCRVSGGGDSAVVSEGGDFKAGEEPRTMVFSTTPHVLKALNVQVVSGRDFTDADGDAKTPVAIVNGVLARSLWPKRTDVVLRWNNVLLDCIRAEKTPPPMAARQLAMMHVAMYDSVNTVYQTHRPYHVALRATEPVEPVAAAAVAAHRMLLDFYPRRRACFDQALEDVGLAAGPLRQVLHDYFAWATTTTMARYHESADDVPDGMVIPRWSWDGLQA